MIEVESLYGKPAGWHVPGGAAEGRGERGEEIVHGRHGRTRIEKSGGRLNTKAQRDKDTESVTVNGEQMVMEAAWDWNTKSTKDTKKQSKMVSG